MEDFLRFRQNTQNVSSTFASNSGLMDTKRKAKSVSHCPNGLTLHSGASVHFHNRLVVNSRKGIFSEHRFEVLISKEAHKSYEDERRISTIGIHGTVF